MINTEENIEKFITLFGLGRDFSAEELNRAYRTLAKLYHPDSNSDTASDMNMVIINEGQRVLKEFLEQRTDSETAGPAFTGKEKVKDGFYEQYKKGFVILQKAFDEYFGETEDKANEGRLEVLKERLLSAKMEFSRLVNDMPYNLWVDDAIDKICSINKWLD